MDKYCRQCGAILRNEDAFCGKCGKKVSYRAAATEKGSRYLESTQNHLPRRKRRRKKTVKPFFFMILALACVVLILAIMLSHCSAQYEKELAAPYQDFLKSGGTTSHVVETTESTQANIYDSDFDITTYISNCRQNVSAKDLVRFEQDYDGMSFAFKTRVILTLDDGEFILDTVDTRGVSIHEYIHGYDLRSYDTTKILEDDELIIYGDFVGIADDGYAKIHIKHAEIIGVDSNVGYSQSETASTGSEYTFSPVIIPTQSSSELFWRGADFLRKMFENDSRATGAGSVKCLTEDERIVKIRINNNWLDEYGCDLEISATEDVVIFTLYDITYGDYNYLEAWEYTWDGILISNNAWSITDTFFSFGFPK